MITRGSRQADFQTVRALFETYRRKGTEHGRVKVLNPEKVNEAHRLPLLAEACEGRIPRMPISAPKTRPGSIRGKLVKRPMKRKGLAPYLGGLSTWFSEFTNGKRPLTMDIATKLCKRRLAVSPAFILKHA